jgi:hypothetical protein
MNLSYRIQSFLFVLTVLACGCSVESGNTSLTPCGVPVPRLETSDVTNRPLALGAKLDVWTEVMLGDVVVENLLVESSNPSVLGVSLDAEAGIARVATLSVGTADVIVRRATGDEHGRVSVTVVAPTAFEIYSKLALAAGATPAAALEPTPHIVVGEEPEFFVRALAGTDVLQLAGVFIYPDTATVGKIERIDGNPDAAATIAVTAAGPQTGTYNFTESGFFTGSDPTVPGPQVVGVATSDITTVAISSNEAAATEGGCSAVVAIPRDASGAIVEGAGVDFRNVSSRDELGHGEGVGYTFYANREATLRATANHHTAEVVVHGDYFGAPQAVGGCSVGQGPGSLASLATIALTLALVAVRSRRARPLA